ncbi:unnamed protein product, partial [Ectocarpus sp. 8 AP-2014]
MLLYPVVSSGYACSSHREGFADAFSCFVRGGGGLCTVYCSRVHPRPPRARTFPPLMGCCWTCDNDAYGKTNHKNSNNDDTTTTRRTRTAITKSTRCARCSRSCAVPRPPTPVRAPGAGPDHGHE